MGRATQGVRGIKLRPGDEVVAATSSADGEDVLLLTSNGYGKRTSIEQFRGQGRGGIGVKAIKLTKARGHLVGALGVTKGTGVFLISSNGKAIRQKVDAISRQQRDSTGVKAMRLDPDTELAAFTVVPPEEDE
jgi:DNA gyrase subunit A